MHSPPIKGAITPGSFPAVIQIKKNWDLVNRGYLGPFPLFGLIPSELPVPLAITYVIDTNMGNSLTRHVVVVVFAVTVTAMHNLGNLPRR